MQVRRKSTPPNMYTLSAYPWPCHYLSFEWFWINRPLGASEVKTCVHLCSPGLEWALPFVKAHGLNLRVCFSWCRPHLFSCASTSVTWGPPIPWSVFSCALESVVTGHACKSRITAGKRPRARRRGKEIEFKYNSLKNEYTARKIIYFSKY